MCLPFPLNNTYYWNNKENNTNMEIKITVIKFET